MKIGERCDILNAELLWPEPENGIGQQDYQIMMKNRNLNKQNVVR